MPLAIVTNNSRELFNQLTHDHKNEIKTLNRLHTLENNKQLRA